MARHQTFDSDLTRLRLDRDARTLLDQAVASGKPPSYSLHFHEARRATRAAAAQLSRPGPSMASVAHHAAPGEGGPIAIRLYTPHELDSPSPLLIFFHGGGFVYCDLDTHDGLCRALADSGRCKVAAVDYRLAPEYGFPAAPNDALAATRWLMENAERLDVTPHLIAVAGDSAGGNLAVGVAQRVKGIAAQLLFYPLLDYRMGHPSHFLNASGFMLTRAGLLWFRSHYLSEMSQRLDPRASPLLASSVAGLPAAFILTAGYDPLRDEGIAYGEALIRAGVAVHHSHFPDQIHGFAMMNRVIAAADRAVQQAGDWLKSQWIECEALCDLRTR